MDDSKYGSGSGCSGSRRDTHRRRARQLRFPSRPPTTRLRPRHEDVDRRTAPTEPALDPSVEKFRSCRWRATPDAGEFCTHRDVLPFAGKEGFKPESWCPECAFYKLRRTPKKRDRNDYGY